MRHHFCIDPGHGGRDSGAVYRGLAEAWIALRVAILMRPLLLDLGHTVTLTRENDVYVPLVQRAKTANKAGAHGFLSVHCNADQDDDGPGTSEARGSEIWVAKNSGLQIADALRPALETRLLGEHFRGIKQAPFTVLTHTAMPAALVEIGFIDCSDTARRLSDMNVLSDVAEGLVTGLIKAAS